MHKEVQVPRSAWMCESGLLANWWTGEPEIRLDSRPKTRKRFWRLSTLWKPSKSFSRFGSGGRI